MSREWVFVTIDGGKTTQDGEKFFHDENNLKTSVPRAFPLKNGWGTRLGVGELQKNARKGKLTEKILVRQLILKDIHAIA